MTHQVYRSFVTQRSVSKHTDWCKHNGQIFTRKQESGKVFMTRVGFYSCYLKFDSEILKLINEACTYKKISRSELFLISGFKKRDLISRNGNFPLFIILKACELINHNSWQFLAGRELFGKTSSKGKITIPVNPRSTDILTILIWLKTEGHLSLKDGHIEINQKNDLKSLYILKKLIEKTFRLNSKSSIIVKGTRGEDRLIISSSPLRQFFCLYYEVPLGYKSGLMKRTDFDGLNQEDYVKLAVAFIQTEGCFSHHHTRNKKRMIPRFEFIVKDRSLALDCQFVLNKLGFLPTFNLKQNLYKVGLYNENQVLKLIKTTEKHYFNDKKIRTIIERCQLETKLREIRS